MTGLFDKLLEKAGGPDGIAKNSRVGKAMRARGVARSADFRRVRDLPRRARSLEEATLLAGMLTDALKTSAGTMRLRPVQAEMIAEAHDFGGLVGSVGVGFGKTLASLLIPVVCEAKRPLLLIPNQLREQTVRRVLPEMAAHWQLHPNLLIMSYSELSLEKNAAVLEARRPDLIVADEAHALKNTASARTRRFLRYMKLNPDCRFVMLSGTITRKSLRDYWHLAQVALPKGCPLPKSWRELQDWADAIDESVREENRLAPGALLELCADDKEPVRSGFRRRLTDTPGFVATTEAALGTSLVISGRGVGVPEEISAALRKLEETWETPDGDEIVDAVDLWRHARELACGFFYRWVWPNGVKNMEWLGARKAWRVFVREQIRHSRGRLDSELQVSRACLKGEAPREAYDAWLAVRDAYVPQTEAVWLSSFLVEDVAGWMREANGVNAPESIVWVEHDAFGKALATATGRPYFAGGPRASAEILEAEGTIAASVHAHSTGKNLQRWARNLIVSCPPSGATWEQLLGRTHRPGQEADEVTAEVYQHTAALVRGFQTAIGDARYIEETTGQKQKLLYARLIDLEIAPAGEGGVSSSERSSAPSSPARAEGGAS